MNSLQKMIAEKKILFWLNFTVYYSWREGWGFLWYCFGGFLKIIYLLLNDTIH